MHTLRADARMDACVAHQSEGQGGVQLAHRRLSVFAGGAEGPGELLTPCTTPPHPTTERGGIGEGLEGVRKVQ